MVAPPATYTDMNGETQQADAMDIRARLVFLGKCHESMAGTGSVCTAAASRVEGSVVNKALRDGAAATDELRIGHPLGVMDVKVRAQGDPVRPEFAALGFARTARRLMAGELYVPTDFAG